MTAARSAWADPHSVRQAARARAVAGLARAYPELYRELYQRALGQARLTLAPRPAHQLASRQARIELKGRLPKEYAARYQAELTLIQPVEPPPAGMVDRHSATLARLRALVWLAEQYPDLARQRLQAEQARLPAAPVDRTPERCRALAWMRVLDGLRAVYPEQFQARYLLELAGQVDQGAAAMTQERASSPEQTLARMLSITRRTGFATPGPWGYVRPSGVICAPDTSDVAHCLHDPDAVFIAHARSDVPWLLGRLQAERSSNPTLDAQLLGRVLVLRAAIRVANEELNALPWQGDGLSGFIAEGLDREQARWVGRVVEALASALDPETLGLKDSDR